MTQIPKDVSFPKLFSSRYTTASRADTEWERIMVQITFAFMIILGYLISVGMSEAQNLATESEHQRRQNQTLRSIVSDLRSTDIGRERAERIRIEKENQLEKLLRAWAEVRTKRRLFEGLRRFDNAELISLSEDLRSLPVEPSFQELNVDIERVFLSDSEKVAVGEITGLMNRVLQQAGFDPAAPQDPQQPPPEAADLYDQANPTPENLRQLKLQIVDDLIQEREELVAMQYALVGKIAQARLEKLADLPIDYDVEVDTDIDAPDLGLRTLNQILDDLHKDMKLLPEAMAKIRGTSASAPNTDEPSQVP